MSTTFRSLFCFLMGLVCLSIVAVTGALMDARVFLASGCFLLVGIVLCVLCVLRPSFRKVVFFALMAEFVLGCVAAPVFNWLPGLGSLLVVPLALWLGTAGSEGSGA